MAFSPKLRFLALAAVLLAAPAGARAQVPAPQAPAPSCKKDGATPRDYLECLGTLQKASESRLDRTMAGALAAIRANEAISGVQRTRWASLMEEAQSRFVYWRNFECQSIAPYEGGAAQQTVGGRLGGIGSLEQRLICVTNHNDARASDLARRYPPPAGWTYQEPVPPPETPASKAAPPAGPVRIIEMPP